MTSQGWRQKAASALSAQNDFSAMVRGDHPDAQQYRRYVLAELRCALIRARCLQHEIKVIGVALAGGVIDEDTAMRWLADAKAIEFLIPTEPTWESSDEFERRGLRQDAGTGAGGNSDARRAETVLPHANSD